VPLGEQIIEFFRGFGPAGLVAALFLIFYLDSMVIPLLPEFFAMIIFQAGGPSLEWGAVVLVLAEAAEVLGNTTTYVIARKVPLPRNVQAAMRKWADVLLAKREKLILTNRIAPAVPFVGFFIAVCGWSYRRSMAYVVVGGLVKYSLLLGIVAGFNLAYDPGLASNLTLAFVVAFVVASLALAAWRRRRHSDEA
jgi:membrane protein YqaA with SNARE-associated domain